MLIDHALRYEALMPTNEGPTQLAFLDIKKVHNRVIGASCKPWVPLGEVQIIHWEEVVLKLVCQFER